MISNFKEMSSSQSETFCVDAPEKDGMLSMIARSWGSGMEPSSREEVILEDTAFVSEEGTGFASEEDTRLVSEEDAEAEADRVT